MSLIALEEHYAWDPVSSGNVVATWLQSNDHVAYQRLDDRGRLRLAQMAAAGIDFQILSLFGPGVQDEPDTAERSISPAAPTTTLPRRYVPPPVDHVVGVQVGDEHPL